MKNNEYVSDYYEGTPKTRFKQTYACAHETHRYKKKLIFFYQIFLFLLKIFTKTPNCIMCSF